MDVFTEAYGRLPDLITAAVDGLGADQLTWTPQPGANPIGWLVWHLTRVQDSHVAELTGRPQVWESDEVAAGFGLTPDPENTGYGHGPAEVAAVRPASAAVLTGYYGAVHERTLEFLSGLTAADLDRVVDEAWDPPVTLGVRLVSILDDDVQHAGQAAYVRGLLP
ncbi:mycothiol transferase [Spirilliplanes yamanashiensis]|uniref:DinB-like domain-containing protein n=1 Tax=Spirilliplanes yamanashiensis TaxID=42233 RepID=A0A8J3YC80_9ACTN|nr:putative damage-inducible protein DinB [Spirilliplanes yamanashiensis]GIJ05419.1 hypothetical protein Sya03_47710 [Spirilliplanes yamanashiensis]